MLKFSELKRIPLRDKWKNEGLEMQPDFSLPRVPTYPCQ